MINRLFHFVLLAALASLGPGSRKDVSASTNDAKSADSQLVPLVKLLGEVDDAGFQRDVLKGLFKALNGRRDVRMPAGWAAVSAKLLKSGDADIRRRTLQLGVIFGDPVAMGVLRRSVRNSKLDVANRRQALQPLVQKRDAKTLPLLKALLDDPGMRGAAIRSLAAYNDRKTPDLLLPRYPKLTDAERQDAVLTLASRPAWALSLLDAVEKKRIPSRDVSAFVIRQLSTLGDKQLDQRIRKVWGTVRPTSASRKKLIAAFKKRLTADVLKKADRSAGRLVFHKTCAACHRLFDDGKRIGPELTGSQRTNLDYLLENVLDPNAVIGRDFQMSILVTDSGRIITGIIKEETAKTLTVQTANEAVILAKADIEARKRSPVSLMPEGQLEKMTIREVRDLFGYLMGGTQVRLPKSSTANGANRRE
jgi:putative heme-binding domain-containing protein